jgi:hypothetical protein
VQVFWGGAGISESAADGYLVQMRSELAWIRRALQAPYRGPTLRQCFRNEAPSAKSERLRKISKLWVHKQKVWFHMQAISHLSGAAKRVLGFALASCGWSIALLMFWFYRWPHEEPSKAEPFVPEPFSLSDLYTHGEWLVIWYSGIILVGGLLIAYCERRSYEELARQYERMRKIFEQGELEINDWLSRDKIQEAQDVLRVLGEEALTENARWLILRRSRPFELVIQ